MTIYAFSIENFKRSKYEVDALMEMAKVKLSQLSQHGDLLDHYGASVRVLGRRELVKADVLEAIDRAVEVTSRNGDVILNICFPYTSRDEISSAIRNTVVDYSTPLDRSQLPVAGQKRQFSESHIAQNVREYTPSAARPGHPRNADNTTPSREDSENSTETDTSAADRSSGSHSSLSSATTLHLQPDPSAASKPSTVPEVYTSYPPNSDQLLFLSPETISTQTLNDRMLTANNPPLDLLVRTSGVERLSDFMLWQAHQNTHIVFLETLWPAFGLWDFLPVLWEWQRRVRKQGNNNNNKVDNGLENGDEDVSNNNNGSGRNDNVSDWSQNTEDGAVRRIKAL